MTFTVGKKITLENCKDLFIIEEIDNNKILVYKIKTGNKVWINKNKIEKIYE